MGLINLQIVVSDIDAVMALYNTIQVQRSKTAPPAAVGENLTASDAEEALLVGSLEGPFLLNGKTLTLKVNGNELSITFTSPDPVAYPDVISELNTVLGPANALALSVDGKIGIQTVGKGTQYTVEMISGTALTVLGFSPGDKANGRATYIYLSTGISLYTFQDASGEASYYYRTRFYQTIGYTYSAWSDWVKGSTSAVISDANLIVGKVKLTGLDGRVLANKKILILNTFSPLKVDGYGIFGDKIELKTDGLGQAETTLVKGSVVDVIFSGTSITRRIRVPETGTEFDLLDEALIVGHDAFTIQVPDLPYAPRQS